MALNIWMFSSLLIVGMMSLVVLIGILIFFGKLMKHQMKIWLLRNRGFVQVRHIRDDMNEVCYFLRIKDDHYNFDGGVYLDQKDTKTKAGDILTKFNYKMLSEKVRDGKVALDEQEAQIWSFFEGIKNNKLMDIKTLSWGIPTITYFGSNINPVNYRDIKKFYDAKNISALMKRLLMTKEWKLVRMVLILCSIAIIGLLVLGMLDYKLGVSNAQNLKACQQMLNESNVRFINLLDTSVTTASNAGAQSSVVTI